MTTCTCRMRLALALASGFAVFALGLAPTFAQNSNTSTFQVTGTVAVTCTVATAPLAFPPYSGAVNVTANTTTTVQCSGIPARPWEIEYDAGANSPTNLCTDRFMTNGAVPPSVLHYILADDPAFANILGLIGEAGCVTQIGPPGVASAVHTVFGVIRAGQTAPSGSYSDVVTVTVWW